MGKPGDGKESHPIAKHLFISLTKKRKTINKFTSLVILIIFI